MVFKSKKKIKEELAKQYFGNPARDYDYKRTKDIRDCDVIEREIEITKKFLLNSKKGKILDVACGTGRLFPFYGKREIYGIDISKDMLKIAKKKFPGAKLVVSDAEKIPFKPNYFPVVITSKFIVHTPNYEKVIKEMNRVVQPGGSIIIDFPNKRSLSYLPTKMRLLTGELRYFNLFTFSKIKSIAKKYNLEIKEVEAKVFLPPRIFPKFLHKRIKRINNKLIKIFPHFSYPYYVRFMKNELIHPKDK